MGKLRLIVIGFCVIVAISATVMITRLSIQDDVALSSLNETQVLTAFEEIVMSGTPLTDNTTGRRTLLTKWDSTVPVFVSIDLPIALRSHVKRFNDFWDEYTYAQVSNADMQTAQGFGIRISHLDPRNPGDDAVRIAERYLTASDSADVVFDRLQSRPCAMLTWTDQGYLDQVDILTNSTFPTPEVLNCLDRMLARSLGILQPDKAFDRFPEAETLHAAQKALAMMLYHPKVEPFMSLEQVQAAVAN